jgi:DNA polymerase V
MDLARPADLQADLFRPSLTGNPALMDTMDRINRRFGRGRIGPAATGWQEKPQWGMRQERLSPCYTTRLTDIPRATC